MSLHASAVELLSSWPVPNAEQDLLREEYLQQLRTRSDAMWRTCRPAHLTASAIILDASARHTLLVLHGKLGRWVQPGGHCEPGDRTLRDAAARECLEETGVTGLEVRPYPVLLSRHGAPCGAETHYDVQFLALADSTRTPTVSEESHDVRWFAVDALPDSLAGGVRGHVAAAVRAATATGATPSAAPR